MINSLKEVFQCFNQHISKHCLIELVLCQHFSLKKHAQSTKITFSIAFACVATSSSLHDHVIFVKNKLSEMSFIVLCYLFSLVFYMYLFLTTLAIAIEIIVFKLVNLSDCVIKIIIFSNKLNLQRLAHRLSINYINNRSVIIEMLQLSAKKEISYLNFICIKSHVSQKTKHDKAVG